MAKSEKRSKDTGSAWIGWVMRVHPDGGISRVRVRLPQWVVDECASAPVSPPTLRSNAAAHLQREMLRDDFLAALVEEGRHE